MDESLDSEFLNALNSDSLLELNLSEKIVYECIYFGLSDAAIAKKLNISNSTATSYRRRLRKSLQQAHKLIELCGMMEKLYPKSRRDYTQNKIDRSNIICVDEDLTVTGSFLKSDVHKDENQFFHPSVIILPYTVRNGKPEFVIREKNRGIVYELIKSDAEEQVDIRPYADIIGGHLRRERMPELENGVRITDSLWRKAAMMKMKDCLRISGRTGDVTEDNLRFLFIDEASRKLEGTSGFNNEISAVFSYKISDVTEQSVRIVHEYTDTIGESYKYRFPSRFIGYDDLKRIAENDKKEKYQPMDALIRVVSRIEKDKSILEQFI